MTNYEYEEYSFDQYQPVKRRKKRHPFRKLLLLIIIAALIIHFFPEIRKTADKLDKFITHDDFATEQASPDSENNGEFTGKTDPLHQSPEPSEITEAQNIPFYNIRYELLQLNEPLLKNFCTMYNAISNFQNECKFPCDMTADDLNLLCELINTECPELFQIDPYNVKYKTSVFSEKVISVSLKYNMTKEEYDSLFQKCNDIIWNITSSTEGQNDYEKEMTAYRYIIENCIYDDSTANSGNVVGVLIENRGKCEGLSKAMKWILENMNIMCLCPFGDSKTETVGHMWNTVRLNGAFYDVDITADTRKPNETRPPLYGAVNVSDSWIRSGYNMNGFAAKRMSIPGYSGMDQSFHALNGRFIYSGESYETVLYRLMHDIYTQGGGTFFIQFEDSSAFSAFITASNSSDQIVSWFNNAGCRSRSFNSEINFSDAYNICSFRFTFH